MSPSQAGEWSLDVFNNIWEHIANGCDFTQDQWKGLKAMYDAEIKYTDKAIWDIFSKARSVSNESDLIFILTSDHGELFGEDGLLEHCLVMNDALTRVPLVMYGEPFDSQKRDIIQHIDIMRTLLEHIDVKSGQLEGVNLKKESRKYAITQRGGSIAQTKLDRLLSYNKDFDVSKFHSSQTSAIRNKNHKLVWSEDGQYLYNLPDETTKIDNDSVESDLKDELSNTVGVLKEKNKTQASTENDGFTKEMKEQLRDLGYIE